MTLCRAPFDFGLGRSNGRQTFSPALKLFGNAQTVGEIGTIGSFRLLEQFGDFGFDLRLQLAGVALAQRPVPGSIRFDFAAVKTDFPEFKHAHLAGNHQDMNEQFGQFFQKSSPKIGNCIMVRMRVGCYVPKSNRIIGAALQFAAGENTRGITVKQECCQHCRTVRLRTATGIGLSQRTKVELGYNLNHKPGKVTVRKPVVN